NALFRRCHKTKRDDCRVAVLLNANVFGGVDRLRIGWLRRGRGTHVVHHLGLVYTTTSRTGVDQIIGPEAFVDCDVVARSASEKVVKEFCELGGIGRSLR